MKNPKLILPISIPWPQIWIFIRVLSKYGMHRGARVVAIPNDLPAVKREGRWQGGGHMLGERIQPPGLEIPGGTCMTCCHRNRLAWRRRKTPLSIGPLLYVWPERRFQPGKRPQAWTWMLIRSLQLIVDWARTFNLSKGWRKGEHVAEEIKDCGPSAIHL